MTDETKKGRWRECEIAGVKRLVWSPPPGSLEEGQPFPFLAYPADGVEVAKEKKLTERKIMPFVEICTNCGIKTDGVYGIKVKATPDNRLMIMGANCQYCGRSLAVVAPDPLEIVETKDEDETWRKDYEAARKFAYHAHTLRDILYKYQRVCASVGSGLLMSELEALKAVVDLCDNIDNLGEAKIQKLSYQDTVFLPPAKLFV